MKHLLDPRSVTAVFSAGVVAVLLTLAGCSASTLSGPDLAPSGATTVQEEPATYGPGAPHNDEGASKDGATTGGSTSNGGGNSNGGANHNTEG